MKRKKKIREIEEIRWNPLNQKNWHVECYIYIKKTCELRVKRRKACELDVKYQNF
jgi:hypothetical protein